MDIDDVVIKYVPFSVYFQVIASLTVNHWMYVPNAPSLWLMILLYAFQLNNNYTMPYYMKLNKAMLLFFPAGSLDATKDASTHESRVVQIIINTKRWLMLYSWLCDIHMLKQMSHTAHQLFRFWRRSSLLSSTSPWIFPHINTRKE